jgi:replicative superfamily II helicase
MVEFRNRLSGKRVGAVIDPVKLYDTLDRAHDKGPLRPAQVAVLEEWFRARSTERDVIVKLHTGQGKTLIGLLMLQARINDKQGPALYLCPDNFLIEQTCEQAKQFHIPSYLVVEDTTTHRKPPEVRICRLRNQAAVGNRPPSTSTPHCPACWARR